jgi:uncharacterized membrane protein YphA (DoxX/SURF4 family)
MFVDETKAKTAWGPLVLRLALGVIFIWHGWVKVTGEGNDWGAGWARTFEQQQNRPPRALLDRLEAMEEEKGKARIHDVITKMSEAYTWAGEQIPETLRFHAVQLAVAWGELAGGLALIFGFLTRYAALGLMVIQIGAIWSVTAAKGFMLSRGGAGYEYNLALIAMCLVLLLEGGGALAVDTFRHARRRRATTTPAAAPEPVAAGPRV